MQITLLIDNYPHPEKELGYEHGLSFYVECPEATFLYDMGASGQFISNAHALGIDLGRIDFAILSHGHADHTGGLPDFTDAYPQKPVYLSPLIPQWHYFTSRHETKRDISTHHETCVKHAEQLRLTAESTFVTPNIAVVYNQCNDYPRPLGNRYLTCSSHEGEEMPDTFEHEMAVALRTPEGLVVLSSCSHGGALNIIESCKEFTGEHRVIAFIGGLHFVDGTQVHEEVEQFVSLFTQLYPHTILYTGHCTGTLARQELSRRLPSIRYFHTGCRIVL